MTRTRTVAAITALALLLLGILAVRGCGPADPVQPDDGIVNTDQRTPGDPITAPGGGDGVIITRD